ncbi:hypothetical protein MNQ98_29030 [Paenibacillus sp. N3/727]|uniref:hypothetical protein n=1 Tax=Paenibacillus sp. N3/727 TaxID=2925845 RepID=UPI001F531A88|nr:hypothetical protein [Paenibacillus sp. N3/727]UNK18399.1 hypothetical protein MNQ98_29030 [Paenibacillus sp. N3/727]
MLEKTANMARKDHPFVPRRSANPSFMRFAAIALTIAGILFVFYPSLRPFSDEKSLLGAAAFASTEWIVSHTMAILAFIFLTIGMFGLYLSLQDTFVEKLVLRGLVLIWVGTGLTLPFYGAEVFSLHAIGQEAIKQQSTDLMNLSNDIRLGPGFFMILAGLIIAAVGSVLAAIAIWKSRTMAKWSGIPFAFGILMYLPQFTGTQPIRVAHGLALAVGCFWIAYYLIIFSSYPISRVQNCQ